MSEKSEKSVSELILAERNRGRKISSDTDFSGREKSWEKSVSELILAERNRGRKISSDTDFSRQKNQF